MKKIIVTVTCCTVIIFLLLAAIGAWLNRDEAKYRTAQEVGVILGAKEPCRLRYDVLRGGPDVRDGGYFIGMIAATWERQLSNATPDQRDATCARIRQIAKQYGAE